MPGIDFGQGVEGDTGTGVEDGYAGEPGPKGDKGPTGPKGDPGADLPIVLSPGAPVSSGFSRLTYVAINDGYMNPVLNLSGARAVGDIVRFRKEGTTVVFSSELEVFRPIVRGALLFKMPVGFRPVVVGPDGYAYFTAAVLPPGGLNTVGATVPPIPALLRIDADGQVSYVGGEDPENVDMAGASRIIIGVDGMHYAAA